MEASERPEEQKGSPDHGGRIDSKRALFFLERELIFGIIGHIVVSIFIILVQKVLVALLEGSMLLIAGILLEERTQF